MLTPVARFVLIAIAAAALAACGSPEAPANPRTAGDTVLQLAFPAQSLEPAQSMFAALSLAYGGGSRSVLPSDVVWTSSNTAVATVDGGQVVARGQGTVTIGARFASRSASQDIKVEWRPDATLSIRVPSDSVMVGARFASQALVRNQTRVQTREWISSDDRIASVDSLGVVTARAVGHATISATFADLRGFVTLEVGPALAGQGFGYLYSYDAPPVDQYDGVDGWNPPPSQAYSTASAPRLYMAPPYPSNIEFGWVGAGAPVPTALLHIVPFDVAPCAAYNNERLDLTWILVGTPVADCFDRQALRASYRMEFIALEPGAFAGTLALVRPEMAAVMSNGAAIKEVDAGIGVRDYEVPGIGRDSLYLFVTPARSELGNCSVAPAAATPLSAMARVICRTSFGFATEPFIYGIGFGADARRGDNPRAFAELDSLGHVLRSSMLGLGISGTRLADPPSATYELSITGERVSEFVRLPAVFLTAVSSNAPPCTMAASRPDASRVLLRVTCAAAVDGLLVGVVY